VCCVLCVGCVQSIVVNLYGVICFVCAGRNKTNIVSFSSQICCESTVKSGVSPAESFNILTWQQMLGKENSATIFPVVEDIYKCKRELHLGSKLSLIPNCKVHYYDIHDGKMIYILTQNTHLCIGQSNKDNKQNRPRHTHNRRHIPNCNHRTTHKARQCQYPTPNPNAMTHTTYTHTPIPLRKDYTQTRNTQPDQYNPQNNQPQQ